MIGSWLVPGRPDAGADAVLVCLPQAGAGCGQYRSWQARLGATTSVLGVQLPGREERWAESPAAQFDAVVRIVADRIAAQVPRSIGLFVYGHSFGGLLGYEVARALGRRHGRWPDALVVAACRPPAMWEGAGRGLVDDPVELDALLRARGLGPDILDEDSRAEMIELLRSDARLSLSYRFEGAAAVPCPLEAWGGTDDPTVTVSQLDHWQDYAAGAFRRRQFPGGHTFHSAQPAPVLAAVREVVSGALLPGKG